MAYDVFATMTAPIALCSIDGEGEGGAGGAAAALLDGGEAAAAEAAGGGDGGGSGDAAAAAAAAAAAGAADPEWLAQFSAEGGDADNPSHRDWLKSKGFKTVDDMAKSYRETEKAFHVKGGMVVPGADAKPEEVEAFHKAIGRPEKADDYAFDLPEGAELADFVGPLREAAYKAGVPAEGFKALGEAMVQHQLDEIQRYNDAGVADREALLTSWGDQKDAKSADVQRAARTLGLSKSDINAIERGYAVTYGKPGAAWTLSLLQKLGGGMSEDMLIGGGGQQRFGKTGAEAQAEIDVLIVDPKFDPVNNPEHKVRWNRLNADVAADLDAKERAASAS